jgi:hypothetical protein
VRQWLAAGFVPGYSGGTMPVLHRLPYYALYGHPNNLNYYIYDFFSPVKEKLRWRRRPTLIEANLPGRKLIPKASEVVFR